MATCLSCQQTIYDPRDMPFGTHRQCREAFKCFKCSGRKGQVKTEAEKRANVCSACAAEGTCWNCGAELLDDDERDKVLCHNCRHG